VSGGRVRLDFNHELAGKNLEYQVKVAGIIEDDAEKVKSLIELHYRTPNLDSEKHQVDIDDDKVIIAMDEMAKFDQRPHMEVTMDRFRIARDIQDNMDIKTVEFVDSFVKKEEVEEAVEEVVNEEVSTEEVPEKLPEDEVKKE
jgi:FKBP-type peptidyl-prolyl cis-trans isomerase SlyD